MRKLLLLLLFTFGLLACTLTENLSSPGIGMVVAEGSPGLVSGATGDVLALAVSPALPATSTPPQQALVTAQAVNLRTCPGLECVILDTLTGGQAVTVSATQTAPDGGTWSNVTTQSGQTGWINSRYLEMQP